MTSPTDVQWLVDRHDVALIASAFWPEARIVYGVRFEGNVEGFAEWSNRSHAERWSREPCHAGRSITEIAFSYGFSNASHFSRAFKLQFGMRPKAYRNQAGHQAPVLRAH